MDMLHEELKDLYHKKKELENQLDAIKKEIDELHQLIKDVKRICNK